MSSISAEQRRRVLDVADRLLEAGVNPTPSALATELGGDGASAPAIRGILKHRRKMYGKSTKTFSESVDGFQSGVQSIDNSVIHFHEVVATGNSFSWVAALPQFLGHLKSLPGTLKNYSRLHVQGDVAELLLRCDLSSDLQGLERALAQELLAAAGLVLQDRERPSLQRAVPLLEAGLDGPWPC